MSLLVVRTSYRGDNFELEEELPIIFELFLKTEICAMSCLRLTLEMFFAERNVIFTCP
jgi:hypothetical protein